MLELFTFRISHFSEKARWLLDASGTEYREVCWTPFFHIWPALRYGRRGTTVPILRHRGGYVQDSTEILLWLDNNMPGFQLLPHDKALRHDVLEWEARFDRIGMHVMRFAYADALDDADAVVTLWTMDATSLQRRLIRSGFPLLRATFRHMLNMSEASVARSAQRIGEALDDLDTELADGREYLVGDRLSAADITACALLAPLVGPAEHPVYAREDFRAGIAARVAPWQARPAFAWVRRRYAQRYPSTSPLVGSKTVRPRSRRNAGR